MEGYLRSRQGRFIRPTLEAKMVSSIVMSINWQDLCCQCIVSEGREPAIA